MLKLVEETKVQLHVSVLRTNPVQTRLKSWNCWSFENLLGDVYLKWKGVFVISGGFNIDLLGELKESTRRYKNLLHTFSLLQHITKATRKNKTITDYISSNMNNKLLHSDVLMTDEISNHDTTYRIFYIKKERYEARYK